MKSRRCDDQALLVDGKTRLPSDPCEYYRGAVRALCGCNRLRCTRCKAWVRGGPPDLGLKPDGPLDRAALYASESWETLPFIGEYTDIRLHTCLCTTWEATITGSIDNDHEEPSDPNVPWACSGHPVPKLPVTLGDLVIGGDMGWAELLGKILGGICPRPLQLEALGQAEGPSSWLGWLYSYLAELPAADELSSALADRIDDSDPLVVGRVIHFFTQFPHATGVERVIAKADADASRVAIGYPAPEHYTSPTLWDVLIARLNQRTNSQDTLDARVTDLARRVLLIPLESLSHEDVGPTNRVEVERQRRVRSGWKVDSEEGKRALDDYAKSVKKRRTDVVVNELERFSAAFNDPELRLWIAEHIVKIDAAAKGRWRPVMNMLSDWFRKPELGHLIVIAGVSLIQAGCVDAREFRDWIKSRRHYGWVDDAWVFPLESLLGSVQK